MTDVASVPMRDKPIGVFDSGVGGLTVVKAVLEHLPHERLIYLGDTARVPYGTRSQHTVLRYSRNAARFLMRRDVKAILIACNTASAAALDVLEQELSVGVLGAVAPGALSAVQHSKTGVMGVVGTLATVRSQAYERAILRLAPQAAIHTEPCPLWVPLVEEGWTDREDPITRLTVARYLSRLRVRAPDLDTLVLGCTHYPLLRPIIAQVACDLWQRPVMLVDSAQAMAEATAALLGQAGLRTSDTASPVARPLSERLTCCVTDEARVAEVGARFLGQPLDRLEVVDLV